MKTIRENLELLKDPKVGGDMATGNRIRWIALSEILLQICEAQGIDPDWENDE